MLRRVFIFFIVMWSFCLFAEETELKFYRPFVDETQLVINKKLPGECWQQSQRIKREDAFRCIAEGRVYDPCFIKSYDSGKEAVCPASPWIKEGIMLSLSSPADNSQHTLLDMAETYPWAIELATGDKCQAIDEGQVYDGLEVHYQCNSQTVLIGRVHRCKANWSILQKTASGVSTAQVARAWF
jgi:hypothetical protein